MLNYSQPVRDYETKLRNHLSISDRIFLDRMHAYQRALQMIHFHDNELTYHEAAQIVTDMRLKQHAHTTNHLAPGAPPLRFPPHSTFIPTDF